MLCLGHKERSSTEKSEQNGSWDGFAKKTGRTMITNILILTFYLLNIQLESVS